MRVCWNWQTGTFEGRVSTDVWVQVPLLAPIMRCFRQIYFICLFLYMLERVRHSVKVLI